MGGLGNSGVPFQGMGAKSLKNTPTIDSPASYISIRLSGGNPLKNYPRTVGLGGEVEMII